MANHDRNLDENIDDSFVRYAFVEVIGCRHVGVCIVVVILSSEWRRKSVNETVVVASWSNDLALQDRYVSEMSGVGSIPASARLFIECQFVCCVVAIASSFSVSCSCWYCSCLLF